MIILLAVLALVVVKALAESPWGVFTVGGDRFPIAMFMGGYLRWMRIGKVLEVSVIGVDTAAARGVGRTTRPRTIPRGMQKPVLPQGSEPLAWSVIILRVSSRVSCRCGCCSRRAITSALS